MANKGIYEDDGSYRVTVVANTDTGEPAAPIANGTNSTGTGIQAVGLVAQVDDTSPTTVTENQFGNLRMSADGKLYTVQSYTGSGGVGLSTAATTAVASSFIAKASSGNVYGVGITTGAAAGYLMVFASATAPVDGAVTPAKVYAVAANSTFEKSFNPPLRLSAGVTLVFSTTGPFTKTASATAFLTAEVQ